MNSFLNFDFQLWFVGLTCLVCFGSNQCPVSIPECNAMYALQASLNLPISITYNQTNPCSKKKKMSKTKHSSKLFFAWFSNLRFKKPICCSIGWQGVNCTSSPNHVTQINWHAQGLTGTICTDVGNLTALTNL